MHHRLHTVMILLAVSVLVPVLATAQVPSQTDGDADWELAGDRFALLVERLQRRLPWMSSPADRAAAADLGGAGRAAAFVDR